MTPKINDPREVVNFAAGPATLPYDVLEEVQENLLDFNDTLISVTETSHRSKDFLKLVEETQDLLREILDIPEDYKILFAHGGASMQFANIAANFPGKQKYLVTGSFAKKAYQEAERMSEFAVGDRNPKAITNDNKPGEDKPDFSYIPSSDDIQNKIDSDSEYLHITDNNTIYGTTIFDVPDVNVPIIADMTSSLLSRKINVSDYAMIYAGFQKNLGPSGTALVLMNDELYNKLPEKKIPNMYSYKKLIDADSGYNTPSTFNIYVANEVLKWVKGLGGVEAVEEICRAKSGLVYDTIDNSNDFYRCPVEKKDRSLTNVVFRIGDKNEDLEKKFLIEASENKLVSLKGHREVGGIRASIYIPMSYEHVQRLADFMEKFQKENS